MAEAADSTGNLGISGPVNCPICLTAYKTPRMLACLHTFCEGCLQPIVKQLEQTTSTLIECPVCMTLTFPPHAADPEEEWVHQLPLNHALQSMLEDPDVENESRKLCDTCAEDNVSETASSFCTTCNKYQCKDCVKAHRKFAATKRHEIVPVAEAQRARSATMKPSLVENCQKHADKTVEFYCEDHKTLCCSSCAILDHRTCSRIAELKTLGLRGEKMDGQSNQLRSKIETLRKELGEVNKIFETNVSNIESESESLIQRVKSVRDRFMKMFDKLVLQVSTQCESLKGEQSSDMMAKLSRNKSLIEAMNSSQILLESVTRQGCARQIYITLHKVERHIKHYEKLVQEARNNVFTTELQLDMDQSVEALIKAGKSLAKVRVTQSNVELENQSDFEELTPIAECVVEKLPRVYVRNRGHCYSGAVYLPDGRLVTADSNENLCCLLDDTYNVTASVKLSSKPFRMTVVGNSGVAVVLPDINKIQIVSVDNSALTLTRTIACKRKPLCVANAGGTDLVLGLEDGFSIIGLDGQEKKYVQRRGGCNDIAVDVNKSRVYLSCLDKGTVCGYGLDGQLLFTLCNTEKLENPSGIDLDRDGNLYVCSHGSRGDSVRQVSPAGMVISIIDLDVSFPYTLCFSPERDAMLVMDGPLYTSYMLKVRFIPPV